MKTELKFNHEAEKTTEAIGMATTADELSAKVGKCLLNWIKGKEAKASQLAESLHKELNYDELLFLATMSVASKVEDIEKAIEADPLMQMLMKIQEKLND